VDRGDVFRFLRFPARYVHLHNGVGPCVGIGIEESGIVRLGPQGFPGEETARGGIVVARPGLVEGGVLLAHAPLSGKGEGLGADAGSSQDSAVGVVGVGVRHGAGFVRKGDRRTGPVEMIMIGLAAVCPVNQVKQAPVGSPDIVAGKGRA